MLILLLLLYLCIGAVITFSLYHLYLSVNRREYGYGYNDKAFYCVIIGIFWLFAAPFAFALYFAKYGIPESSKKRGKDE